MMEADEYVDLELHVDGLCEVQVYGKVKDALREMRHYLAQYKDDGACKIYEVRRVELRLEDFL